MIKVLRVPPMYKCIGLVDADLLDNGTRHPNLTLLKIAGLLYDNNILFELILDKEADISRYTIIYMSRVFTFTKLPELYTRTVGTPEEKKFRCGGTGFYANVSNVKEYSQKRAHDMISLEKDEFLNTLRNNYRELESNFNKRKSIRPLGIDMARQKPYYHLYDTFVNEQVKKGFKKEKYKDYQKFSIGFLTRGCFRHCPFCINKLENHIFPYSELDWFIDNERDEKGRLVRPYIYLWDDNFLASKPEIWRPLLQKLIDTKRPFQFRQGLDERILTESEYGEEMVKLLSQCNYHGDFIFAFDNWKDRELIEKALKLWKRYNPKKGTKFYLFCGFKLEGNSHSKFYKDIWELFQRIKVLMSYGCVGYVMRHEDYHNYELSNLYVQIARWCNQQQFYKKMSFWEFVYRNQSYWEEHTLHVTNRPQLKTYEEFMVDLENGYYDNVKMCLPLQTLMKTIDKFPKHREELLEMFNYKMSDLVNPKLWE